MTTSGYETTYIALYSSLPSGLSAPCENGGGLNGAACSGPEASTGAAASALGGRWCDGWGAASTANSNGNTATAYALPRAELLPTGSAVRLGVPGMGLMGSGR